MKKYKNIIKFSNLKKLLVIIILLIIFIFISAISYVSAVSENISESVFRLHVIANSNDKEDQDLKYLVRDKLLEYMDKISSNCKDKQEVIKVAQDNIYNFKKIAEDTIRANNYNYNITVEIGNFDFPTKDYGDISLPAGMYDALKVKIGKAEGQNWWCVMFPPLCFVDVTSGIVPEESKQIMKDSMSTEEYDLISKSNSSEINFKFKLIELFENIKLVAKK